MEINHDVDVSDLLKEPKKRINRKITYAPIVSSEPEKAKGQEKAIPEWFESYKKALAENKVDLLEEIKNLSTHTYEDISKRIGGPVENLPYDVLRSLFINGFDDEKLAGILRDKRTEYLNDHPEEVFSKNASEGVITFDGRFISKADWDTATDSEKRAIMVGSTCFHYNSDTPGMGSNVNDRW